MTEAGSLSDPFTVGRRGVGKPHNTKSGWKRKITSHQSTTTRHNTIKYTHLAKSKNTNTTLLQWGGEGLASHTTQRVVEGGKTHHYPTDYKTQHGQKKNTDTDTIKTQNH